MNAVHIDSIRIFKDLSCFCESLTSLMIWDFLDGAYADFIQLWKQPCLMGFYVSITKAIN